jgi:hypothetical protein
MTEQYIKWLHYRIAGLAIGRSTLRNQGAPGVIAGARRFLRTVKLEKFCVGTSNDFKKVLDNQTEELRKQLPRGTQNWGTARKELNIFLRDILYNRHLCKHYRISHIEKWLEVPLDSYVVKGLTKDNPRTDRLPRWSSIKRLTPETSEAYQKVAQIVAKKEGVVPVHLDIKYWRGEKLQR